MLVIGGGATGAELAAEIAQKYPNKHVTLLHNSKRLIHPDFSDKFQTKIKAMIQSQRPHYTGYITKHSLTGPNSFNLNRKASEACPTPYRSVS